MKRKGIDVSKWQGNIDWKKVKEDGIDFAMLRLGYGTTLDPTFEQNVKGCEENDIKWGAYLYSYALSVGRALEEGKFVLKHLKGKSPEFPIAFDMEDADGYKKKKGMPSGDELVDICHAFLDCVEDAGYYVVLYASKSWLNGRLKSDKLNRFDKWVAQWSDECTYNGKYNMWQYTSNGKVKGIDGDVDLNLAYSDFQFDSSEEVPKKEIKETPKEKTMTYTVVAGDNLIKISKKYKTTVAKLMEMNPFIENPNRIYVNQTLNVPYIDRKYKQHQVMKGDTLSEIANRYNTTVKALMNMNEGIKNKNMIYVGQVIKVPNK